MEKKKLTDSEVKVMLHVLKDHFGEPVLPVSRYCNSLKTWARAIVRLNTKADNSYGHGSAYYQVLENILIDIQKSNFLWRLIYEGEKLRTQECPIHKGHLSMSAAFNATGPCPHGCDYTGWCHEPDQEKE